MNYVITAIATIIVWSIFIELPMIVYYQRRGILPPFRFGWMNRILRNGY